jgi:hypothetical protein
LFEEVVHNKGLKKEIFTVRIVNPAALPGTNGDFAYGREFLYAVAMLKRDNASFRKEGVR